VLCTDTGTSFYSQEIAGLDSWTGRLFRRQREWCDRRRYRLFSTQPAVKPRAYETTSNYATATNHTTVDSTSGASSASASAITTIRHNQTGFVGVWDRSNQVNEVGWFRPLGVRAQERRLYNGTSLCI
jgi:hypothetical protein